MTRDGEAPPGQVLRAMEPPLAHRGPDDAGYYRSGDVAMMQARLAIIDLKTGDQPLYEPGGAALIANAEIYNYIELRAELADVEFSTQSDCELPLHLFRRHGLDFTQHLRGMYAIALYDPAERRLVLARDPFGIKPLYYVETPAYFAFASEPQALIAAGIVSPVLARPVRDLQALADAQFSTGRETIFSGINRVLPGETIVVRQDASSRRRRRMALPEGALWRSTSTKPCGNSSTRYCSTACGCTPAFGRAVRHVPLGRHRLDVGAGDDGAPRRAPGAGVHGRVCRRGRRRAAGGARARPRGRGRAHRADLRRGRFLAAIATGGAGRRRPGRGLPAMLPTFKLAEAAHQAEAQGDPLRRRRRVFLLVLAAPYRSVMRPWWLGGRAARVRGMLDGLGVLREEITGWRDGVAAAERAAPAGNTARLPQAVDCADWLATICW